MSDEESLREATERGHRDGWLDYVNSNPYAFDTDEWDAYQTAWDAGQRERDEERADA